jgi:hypothetical protein
MNQLIKGHELRGRGCRGNCADYDRGECACGDDVGAACELLR